MNCFNPVPGKPNSILTGKSRLTGMSPTIVKKDGKPFFVVGSPGGTRIVVGNLQTILNVIDHKMSATEAVSAPRFDSQSGVIETQGRIPLSILEQVRTKGHPIRRTFSSYGGVALVHGILVNKEAGILEGAADPAGSGMALYVPA
jgi:gamma-glutamyltranspeptidase/glutathione hydrolase